MAKKEAPFPSQSPSNRRWILGLGVLAVAVAAYLLYRQTQIWRSQYLLSLAMEKATLGLLNEAEASAELARTLNPALLDAYLVAGKCALFQREFERAARHIKDIDASKLSTEQLIELYSIQAPVFESSFQLRNAIAAYSKWTELVPENIQAHIQIATLKASCGLREQAIENIIRVVESGMPTDLLILLARESGSIQDSNRLEQAIRISPGDPLPRVGLAYYALEADDVGLALKYVDEAIKLSSDYVPARLMKLRILLAMEDWNAIESELMTIPDEIRQEWEQSGIVWLARGSLCEQRQNLRPAVRCYAETAWRQPDSRTALTRLAQLLPRVGDATESEVIQKALQSIHKLRGFQDRVLFFQGEKKAEDVEGMLEAYEECGRLWEARGWSQMALTMFPRNSKLRNRVSYYEAKTKGLARKLVAEEYQAIAKLDWKRFPLPTRDDLKSKSPNMGLDSKTESWSASFEFVDQSEEVGLNFEYHNGIDGATQRYMFELTGGGIGVIDYDLDGWPDLVFTQGRPWPIASALDPMYRDRLFRNREGRSFSSPIALPLGLDAFGQGVAVGDVNDDGFPDLYLAQIDSNRLLLNQGDGTFSDVTDSVGLTSKSWTTSCVIADLTGDGYPDLYDINYVAGADVFSRRCLREGIQAQCAPSEFEPARDQLWVNDGQGGFWELNSLPTARGLGALAFDSQSDGSIELFVANDTDPNFLLNFSKEDGGLVVQETGIASGVAFNGAGKAEGSMGIAAADLNQDGWLDLFVTNFLAETNTLYESVGPGAYVDRTKRYGLSESSYDRLGFGTQLLDANLDGWLELIIANGHVDDLRALGRPYKMPPLIYTQSGSRFDLVKSAGDYFQRELLGRAMVKLDWNGDFLEDLVVGHLHSPYALLTNRSQLVHSAIVLKLVGRASNRDAVGARVIVSQGEQRAVQQVTAGDGYQCSNGKELTFAVKPQESAMIEIHWPSGIKQRIKVNQANQRFTVVEPVISDE